MELYAAIEKDESRDTPILTSKIFSTKNEAEKFYKEKIQDLCNMDEDCPIDESELDNVELISFGDINVLDACADSENLISLYLISIMVKEG